MLVLPPPASEVTAAQISEAVWQMPPPPPPPVQHTCPSPPQATHRLLVQRR
jgi:hypothetical protein